jgi:hydrogenase expression/formation protein
LGDLEGLVRSFLKNNIPEKDILNNLVTEILNYKRVSRDRAEALAKAVINEVQNSMKYIRDPLLRKILEYPQSHVTMGVQGVGCRGEGDFFVHRKIAEIAQIGPPAALGPKTQDDAGAVKIIDGEFIVISVDGMHSRLSEYPFLAGFHATRAALRDIYVKGAKPVAILVDVHLADDADVGKLFDFMAGCATVANLSKVPIVAGSTLRIGGDMVIGERMTGCVGAVGLARKLLAREFVSPGDKIIMTEGSGGGTITTAAIYSGNFDVILRTLNIQFINAFEVLFKSGVISKVKAATDWTNGGLRGDTNEICSVSNVGMKIYEDKVVRMLDSKVLEMLRSLGIDYLGVSMDALLIFSSPANANEILDAISNANIKAEIIGEVVNEPKQPILISNGLQKPLKPLYREAAYTTVKKLISESTPENKEKQFNEIERVVKEAATKATMIINYIESKRLR